MYCILIRGINRSHACRRPCILCRKEYYGLNLTLNLLFSIVYNCTMCVTCSVYDKNYHYTLLSLQMYLGSFPEQGNNSLPPPPWNSWSMHAIFCRKPAYKANYATCIVAVPAIELYSNSKGLNKTQTSRYFVLETDLGRNAAWCMNLALRNSWWSRVICGSRCYPEHKHEP